MSSALPAMSVRAITCGYRFYLICVIQNADGDEVASVVVVAVVIDDGIEVASLDFDLICELGISCGLFIGGFPQRIDKPVVLCSSISSSRFQRKKYMRLNGRLLAPAVAVVTVAVNVISSFSSNGEPAETARTDRQRRQ